MIPFITGWNTAAIPPIISSANSVDNECLVAAATFAVLDLFAPNSSVASAARQGAGFGIGANLVGFPRM